MLPRPAAGSIYFPPEAVLQGHDAVIDAVLDKGAPLVALEKKRKAKTQKSRPGVVWPSGELAFRLISLFLAPSRFRVTGVFAQSPRLSLFLGVSGVNTRTLEPVITRNE